MTQSTVFGAVPAGAGQQVLDDLNLCDQALATEHEGDERADRDLPVHALAQRHRQVRQPPQRRQQRLGDHRELRRHRRPDDRRRQRRRLRARLAVDQHQRQPRLLLHQPGHRRRDLGRGRRSAARGATSVFGRTGAVVAVIGDYTADQIDDGGGKVLMTSAERTTLAAISFPAKVIPLAGTGTNADNANIRAAIAAIKASGQPGEILMSGDFKIGHAGRQDRHRPGRLPVPEAHRPRHCRWYKGVAATTTGLTGGNDPGDGTAYPLLARDTDDGPGKRLVIRNIIFEGDLATTRSSSATPAG